MTASTKAAASSRASDGSSARSASTSSEAARRRGPRQHGLQRGVGLDRDEVVAPRAGRRVGAPLGVADLPGGAVEPGARAVGQRRADGGVAREGVAQRREVVRVEGACSGGTTRGARGSMRVASPRAPSEQPEKSPKGVARAAIRPT